MATHTYGTFISQIAQQKSNIVRPPGQALDITQGRYMDDDTHTRNHMWTTTLQLWNGARTQCANSESISSCVRAICTSTRERESARSHAASSSLWSCVLGPTSNGSDGKFDYSKIIELSDCISAHAESARTSHSPPQRTRQPVHFIHMVSAYRARVYMGHAAVPEMWRMHDTSPYAPTPLPMLQCNVVVWAISVSSMHTYTIYTVTSTLIGQTLVSVFWSGRVSSTIFHNRRRQQILGNSVAYRKQRKSYSMYI